MSKNIERCYRDRDADGAIVAWDVGTSKEETAAMLKMHPSWYPSIYDQEEEEAI